MLVISLYCYCGSSLLCAAQNFNLIGLALLVSRRWRACEIQKKSVATTEFLNSQNASIFFVRINFLCNIGENGFSTSVEDYMVRVRFNIVPLMEYSLND